jgi:AcrR family transcriptional regulator
MTENAIRRRAPGTAPERRREMIVAAAVPLVAEFGTAVTTAKIARAAGIGEATIFRVFADKEELLDACIVEVLRPDTMVAEIGAIPLDQPLADRLTQAADALRAYLERMGAVMGALRQSGHRNGPRERGTTDRPSPAGAREESTQAVREAVAELLAPEQDQLRLPAQQVAGLLLNQVFSQSRLGPVSDLDTAALIDIFLYGVAGRTEARK